MLIRITHHCTMGCRHCFIAASGPTGEHMSWETFVQSLAFARKLGVNLVFLSGGEPTDHPEIERMVRTAQDDFLGVALLSNGLFALDEDRYQRVQQLVADKNVFVQVTNDPRYYPQDLSHIRHKFEVPGFSFTEKISILVPSARTQEHQFSPTRLSPTCFNLRANTRKFSLSVAVTGLERALRFCTPSINPDGSVCAGEMDICHRVGTVSDPIDAIQKNLRRMSCNTCGLRDNLEPRLREMIGETAEG